MPQRALTVFRTNLYSAHSIVQLDQISQMADRFPLWRYVAILDGAARPDHAALNGSVFRIGEGPYPPIDFNCRCTAQHLHTFQVDEGRIKPSQGVQMPETVRRFDLQGEFERYVTRSTGTVDPGVLGAISELTFGFGSE